MRRGWAGQVVGGQSTRIFEERLDTETSVADTVDASRIAAWREVSLSIDSPCQRKRWGAGRWRENSQAGKQLGWPAADHCAFLVPRRINGS